MDRVVSFNDQLFVMDHKTTTTTPSQYYFNQYEPHNQMTLYTMAMGCVWVTLGLGSYAALYFICFAI